MAEVYPKPSEGFRSSPDDFRNILKISVLHPKITEDYPKTSEDFPILSEGLRILSEILRRERAPLSTLVIVLVKK